VPLTPLHRAAPNAAAWRSDKAATITNKLQHSPNTSISIYIEWAKRLCAQAGIANQIRGAHSRRERPQPIT